MIRVPSPTAVLLAVLAGATSLAAVTSWSVLTEDAAAYFRPLAALVVLIALSGLVLRAVRLPGPLVPLGQLGILVVALNHRWAAAESLGGWVPTPASLGTARDTLAAAVEASAAWAAPVPADVTAFAPLLIGAGVIVALLVDVAACSWRAPSLAGLPLIASLTAAWAIVDRVPWTAFVLTSILFVLLLAADHALRLSGWGRTVAIGPEAGAGAGPSRSRAHDLPHRVTLGMLLPGALTLGVGGVALAAAVPVLTPDHEGFVDRDTGGGGSGGGGASVSLTNPMVDLRRDLVQGPDVPLVFVETEQSAPGYLRTTVLDEFDGLVWKPAERSIPVEQRAAGALPAPPGLSAATPQRSVEHRFGTTPDFRSEWLPVPYPATRVEVPGDWRYDTATLDLITTEGAGAAAALEYAATTLELQPTAEQLVAAPRAPRSIVRDGTDLPDETPRWIRDLAEEVTQDAASDFERAVVLQSWFRRDGGFVYSLERGAGSDLTQLELFLGEGPGSRTGYCEQFSAAMAMMARALGIPARVAVGFLRPEPAGARTWVYSSRDLHAWPELYFEGAGWIRFEPTPQDRATGVPAYTEASIPRPQEAPSPSAATSPSPTSTAPDSARDIETDPVTSTTSDDTSHWWLVLPALALGGALLFLPRARRTALTRRRASGAPGARIDGAWEELRATALDLRHRWDDSQSLRAQARALVAALGSDPAVLSALQSLVLLVERHRYSAWASDVEAARSAWSDQLTVAGALHDAAAPRARRRARWLPASLWRGRRFNTRASATPVMTERETEKVSL